MAGLDLLTPPKLCVVWPNGHIHPISTSLDEEDTLVSLQSQEAGSSRPPQVLGNPSLHYICRFNWFLLMEGRTSGSLSRCKDPHLLTPKQWPQGLEAASLEGTCDRHQAQQSLQAWPAVDGLPSRGAFVSPPQVPPAGKAQCQAGRQLSPSSSPLKVLSGGIISQSDGVVVVGTRCFPAWSLQRRGCLIKECITLSSAHTEN